MSTAILSKSVIKRRRWRPRFSLRTLIIAFTIGCSLIGGAILWYRVESDECKQVDEVARQIEKLGGIVCWQPIKPVWLDTMLSDHGLNVFHRPYLFVCTNHHRDVRDVYLFGNNPNMTEIIKLLTKLPSVHLVHAFDTDLQAEQLDLLANERQVQAIIVDTSMLKPYLEDDLRSSGQPITGTEIAAIAQQSAEYSKQRIAQIQQALPNMEVVSAH